MRWRIPLGLLLLGALTGCVDSEYTSSPQEAWTFTYATWVPLTFLGVGLCIMVAGWMVSRPALGYRRSFGLGAVAAGALLLIASIPATFFSRVTVTENEVKIIRGPVWFVSSISEISFEEVERIRIDDTLRPHAPGRAPAENVLIFTMKDGRIRKFRLDALLHEAAPKIEERARFRLIPIDGQ